MRRSSTPLITKPGLTLLGILGIAVGMAPLADALDWPQWRGPDLNGISRETGWLTEWPDGGPKRLWRARVGIGFSSLAVSRGRVYTAGNQDGQDTVYGFDAESGEEIWTHRYPCDLGAKYYEGGTSATPTVDGDRVYTLSKQGDLFCLGARDGTVIWSRQLTKELGVKPPSWGFAGSVLVQGDTLYLNVGSHGMAVNKNTGESRWSSGKTEAGYATPVPFTLGGQSALAVFSKRELVAVDSGTGQVLWQYPWRTQYDVNAADPIVRGSQLFISSGYNHGGALLELEDGEPKPVWENKEMRNLRSLCVLINEHLYGFDQDGDLKCVDWKTGSVAWSESGFSKGAEGALMAADGNLIALSQKGELVVAPADPTGFKPISRAQVLGGKCWTVPVLANARIYCRNAAGDVVCLDVKP